MFWQNSSELATKSYIQYQITKHVIEAGLFFTNTLNEALTLLAPPPSARLHLTPDTCYPKMYIIPIDKNGIEQLRLLRSFENIQEEYLRIVFDDGERDYTPNDYIDGIIESTNTSVMFN